MPRAREKITGATAALFTELFTEPTNKIIPDERFIRPEEVQAAGAVVGEDELPELPVVDMARLVDPKSSALEMAKMGSACREWGFFQLKNHGVDEAAIQQVKESVAQFFSSPLESKSTVAVRDGLEGYGHHFSRGSSEKLGWAECLLLVTQPVQRRTMDFWPPNPPMFRQALDRYSVETRDLIKRLLSFMATDLGVSQEVLLGAFFADGGDKGQTAVINHYPPCPHPDKVVGFPPHTDTLGLSILLPVDDTPGLQFKKDGRWFPMQQLPGALVVIVADILDVLSNGNYISPEHRVVPDAERDRITVAIVQDACLQGMVTPLPELLLAQQARYRSITKPDYTIGSVTGLAQWNRFVDSLVI